MRQEFLTQSDIEAVCEEMEPAILMSARLHDLPYIPLIPSLRAYALLEMSWPSFVAEYKKAVVTSMRSGCNFAYMD